MRLLIAFMPAVFLAAMLCPAGAQDMSAEELERMIEELDAAIEQTDGLIEQADQGTEDADRTLDDIDRTLEQAGSAGAMAPLPLIGADGTEIDPRVGVDLDEALWCLNGLDVFSQMVTLDDGEMAVINSGLDFFADVAIESGQILGLNDSVVLTMLEEGRSEVIDTLDTAPHPTQSMTMIEYCVQAATLYHNIFAEAG